MVRRARWILFAVAVLQVSCGGAKTPADKIAGQFMDHYYVEMDLNLALEDCDGFARSKVGESIRLTGGQAFDGSAHHPKISYRLLEARAEPEEASYLYEVDIRPKGMDPIRKKARLKVRARGGAAGGGWKVTQFSDYDYE